MKKLLFSFCILISTISNALYFNNEKIMNIGSKGNSLKADEGYLFLSLNTDFNLDKIIINPLESGKKMVFRDVKNGENYALIKLKIGLYYWSTIYIDEGSSREIINLNKKAHPIKIKAGIINYPGSWKFTINDFINNRYYYNFYLTNKSSEEFPKFRNRYPQLAKEVRFSYQAEFRDPFLNFYSKFSPDGSKNEMFPKINKLQKLELYSNYSVFDPYKGVINEVKKNPLIKKYLKANSYSVKSMNQKGELVLATMVEGNISTIAVLNLKTFKSYSILTKKLQKDSYISEVKWIDNNSIFFRFGNRGIFTNHIANLKIDKYGDVLGVNMLNLPTNGFLINPLINEEDKILFYKRSNYRKKFGIFKVNVSDKNSIFFSLKKRISRKKIFNNAYYWLSDNDGNLMFTVTGKLDKKTDESTIFYWFRESPKDDWKMIKSFNTDEDFIFPSIISSDRKNFYVISSEKTDKGAVLAYSTKDFSFERIVYEDPSLNVESILVDSTTNDINGIRFFDKGVYKSKYFDSKIDYLKNAKNINPNLNLYSVQVNEKAGLILLFGTKLDSEGAWYIYNIKDQTFIKLLDADPEYEKLVKGVSSVISIVTTDGLNVEGYLVQPKNQSKKTPLIVIPHGGPVGVRDYAHNDSVQHFLASKGFSSLKVNYRGSAGYGKAFKDKGNQEWGEKIEEDINEIVSYAVREYQIDGSKICAMGGSYGGYSAIMLTIKYPDRYQCAVSIAGVTDLPLKFSSYNWYDQEKTLKKLKKIIGNPTVNLIELTNKSPVYNYHRLTKPILLFQGQKDKNVTPEHAKRLFKVANESGKDIELIMFKDEGHSFKHIESQIYYLSKSIEFLKKNLRFSK